MSHRVRHAWQTAFATLVLAAGCATAQPSTAPSATAGSSAPAGTEAPAPTATLLLPTPTAAIIVTFEVAGGEHYRVRLTEADDIAIARELLEGREAPRIPNGRLVRGTTDVNTGHDWSIDPADIEFADVTTEVCDGLPSQIDDGTFGADRYCPWAATVVAIDPAP